MIVGATPARWCPRRPGGTAPALRYAPGVRPTSGPSTTAPPTFTDLFLRDADVYLARVLEAHRRAVLERVLDTSLSPLERLCGPVEVTPRPTMCDEINAAVLARMDTIRPWVRDGRPLDYAAMIREAWRLVDRGDDHV